MRALLVMDMQEALLGRQRDKKFNYESDKLIKSVNEEITKYSQENIYYIKTVNKKNIFGKLFTNKLYESDENTKLVENLKVVGKHFFDKDGKDAFRSNELAERLKKEKIDELQIVGVDVCGSISKTVFSAINKGFKIVLNKNLMASTDSRKSEKVCKKMKEKGAKILN